MATISFAQAGPSRLTMSLPRLMARAMPLRLSPLADRSSAGRSILVAGGGDLGFSEAASAPMTSLRSLVDSLVELFPPFLLAVPKKKVSHSRKSMRSAHKGLKNKTNITLCPGCGAPKLAHNLCPECFSQINRKWKQEARQAAPEASS